MLQLLRNFNSKFSACCSNSNWCSFSLLDDLSCFLGDTVGCDGSGGGGTAAAAGVVDVDDDIAVIIVDIILIDPLTFP